MSVSDGYAYRVMIYPLGLDRSYTGLDFEARELPASTTGQAFMGPPTHIAEAAWSNSLSRGRRQAQRF